jgi:hypothetical protein
MSTVSSKIDLRYVQSTILDQGIYNTCAENTLSSVLESQTKLANHAFGLASRMQSYVDARTAVHEFGPQYGDIGTFSEVMLNQSKTTGLAPESMWDYSHSIYDVPPASVYTEAAKHKVSDYSQIGMYQNYAGIASTIKAQLTQGKEVMLSFHPRDYFYAESGSSLSALVGNGLTDSSPGALHMVKVVGYDDNLNGGSYIIQNSWGTSWGNNGFGIIKYSQFSGNSDFNAAYVVNGFNGMDWTWSDSRVNVAQHYAAILGRAGELSGVDFYASANVTDEALTGYLLNSTEGQLIYGGLTDSQFVESMYGSVLGRHSDADGMAFYTAALANGSSRASIMNMVINAVEAPNAEAAAHDFLMNKTNMSAFISVSLQYTGGQDTVTRAELAQVTSDANSLEIIKTGIAHDLHYVT